MFFHLSVASILVIAKVYLHIWVLYTHLIEKLKKKLMCWTERKKHSCNDKFSEKLYFDGPLLIESQQFVTVWTFGICEWWWRLIII